MSSHMVRAEDRHLKSWGEKKPKNITFISQAPFFKKLVKNGWRGKGRGHRRKRKKGGGKREGR